MTSNGERLRIYGRYALIAVPLLATLIFLFIYLPGAVFRSAYWERCDYNLLGRLGVAKTEAILAPVERDGMRFGLTGWQCVYRVGGKRVAVGA